MVKLLFLILGSSQWLIIILFKKIFIKKIEDEKKKEEKSKDDFETSKLPTSVKNLVQLIFDLKMMNNQMKEIGYDAKKMPLGKLSKSNIEKGYKILSDIAECLKKTNAKSEIEKLSSDFYSYIPHDFGFQYFFLC